MKKPNVTPPPTPRPVPRPRDPGILAASSEYSNTAVPTPPPFSYPEWEQHMVRYINEQ